MTEYNPPRHRIGVSRYTGHLGNGGRPLKASPLTRRKRLIVEAERLNHELDREWEAKEAARLALMQAELDRRNREARSQE